MWICPDLAAKVLNIQNGAQQPFWITVLSIHKNCAFYSRNLKFSAHRPFKNLNDWSLAIFCNWYRKQTIQDGVRQQFFVLFLTIAQNKLVVNLSWTIIIIVIIVSLTLRRRYFFEYTEDGWGRFLPHVECKYTAIV